MSEINLVDNKWNIGSHIPFENNITNSIKFAIDNGMYSFQIFLGSPQAYDRACISETDITSSAKLLSKFPTNLFIHTPFLFNLCGSVKQLAWEGDSKQDSITSKVVNSIQYELEILDKIADTINTKIFSFFYAAKLLNRLNLNLTRQEQSSLKRSMSFCC